LTQESELPPDVQIFLRDRIESYEQLELLLLMCADSEASWTQEMLSSRTHMAASLVQGALKGLESAGLVDARGHASETRYTYRRQHDSVEVTINRLATAYREYPIPIIKLMSANAIERLRTAALRTFADAFILGKDKNRG